MADGRLTFVEADVTEPGSSAAAVEAVDAVIQAAQFQGAPVEDPARGLTYEPSTATALSTCSRPSPVYGRHAGPAGPLPEGSPASST